MGRSVEDHAFVFDDAAAARRGADLLRLAVLRVTPKERAALRAAAGLAPGARAPASAATLGRVLKRHADEAAIASIEARDVTLTVGLELDDDIDVDVEGTAPSSSLREALEACARELGGLTEAGRLARDRARARTRELAEAHASGPELLARLDAVKDRLLRYELVFLDSLRTSVAAGAVLDGQRLEGLKVLRRIEGTPDEPTVMPAGPTLVVNNALMRRSGAMIPPPPPEA